MRRISAKSKGQAAVETALLLPFILSLIVFFIGGGILLMDVLMAKYQAWHIAHEASLYQPSDPHFRRQWVPGDYYPPGVPGDTWMDPMHKYIIREHCRELAEEHAHKDQGLFMLCDLEAVDVRLQEENRRDPLLSPYGPQIFQVFRAEYTLGFQIPFLHMERKHLKITSVELYQPPDPMNY